MKYYHLVKIYILLHKISSVIILQMDYILEIAANVCSFWPFNANIYVHTYFFQ